MSRKSKNIELIRQLKHYVTMNPDMRLGQALRNLGIVVDRLNPETHENEWVNGFNEEPDVTLERVLKRKKEQKEQK